jgi:hypothetical protein
LKCWATGVLAIILKKKRLPGVGSCSPKFTNWIKTGCMSAFLKEMKKKGYQKMKRHIMNGKK